MVSNRAAAEIDFYGGIRPTFGKLALDFGVWEYWYPGGTCFNGAVLGECAANADPLTGGLPINGNVVKADLSFLEGYGKFTYTVNDQFSFGGSVFYSPSVLNSGADGTYVAGTAKYVLPNLAYGIGWFVSGDVGHWFLGTSDSFYGLGTTYAGGLYALGDPLQELYQLGRGTGVHVEAIHARPALIRYRFEQGRLQCLHQRPDGKPVRQLYGNQPERRRHQLVRCDIHRQIVGRFDGGQPQIRFSPAPSIEGADEA